MCCNTTTSFSGRSLNGVSTSLVIVLLWLVSLSVVVPVNGAPHILKAPRRPEQHARHQHSLSVKNIDRVNTRLSYFLKQLNQQQTDMRKLHRSCRIDFFTMNKIVKKVNVVGNTPIEKVNRALLILRDTQKDFIEQFGKLISMNITTDKGNFNNTARKEILRNIQCFSNNFYLDVQGVIDESHPTNVVNKCNKDNLYNSDLVQSNYKDACLADWTLFYELKSHLSEWKKTLIGLKKQLRAMKQNEKKNNAARKPANKKPTKKPAQPANQVPSRPTKAPRKPKQNENLQL